MCMIMHYNYIVDSSIRCIIVLNIGVIEIPGVSDHVTHIWIICQTQCGPFTCIYTVTQDALEGD